MKENKEENIQDFSETKRLDFKNHLSYLETYFSFLITEFGFQLKTRRFFSREFWTIYTNSIFDLKIMFESGSELPWVYFEKCNQIDKYLLVYEYSDKLKLLKQMQNDRVDPMMSRFVENNYDLTELHNDYIEVGQFIHREYMEESALTIKNIIENKILEKTFL